mmetsp:Transcript_21666/g.67886  ORF Transcript_21666/g.67886 Transcript_21666/m.67886 type:complete len:718 (-) Transcript_21666:470-2623(-)
MAGPSLNANAAAWTPGGATSQEAEEGEEEWERVDVAAVEETEASRREAEEAARRRQQVESILEAEGTWGDDDDDEPPREVVEEDEEVVADEPAPPEPEPEPEREASREAPQRERGGRGGVSYQAARPGEYQQRSRQYQRYSRSGQEDRPRRVGSGSNLAEQQNGEAAGKSYQKPAWARAGDESSEAVALKKAKSILNKLTLEKFERLSAEFVALELSSVELVAGAIDLIVDKAQRETHFVEIYAELCVKLAATPLAGLGETEKGKKFRRLLLERCQAEFERDDAALVAEIEAIADAAERAARVATLRKLYIGHMYFIGALYKQELLRETIMHHCIQELFGDPEEPDDDKIECLAKLLTTIGKQLDAAALEKKESQKFMKAYFKHLNRLTKSEKLAVRIRFLVRDLCELRDNDWKPRRVVEKAKTIAEIHEDVQREEDEKNGKKPNASAKKDAKDANSKDRSSRVADDGWETVGTAKFVPTAAKAPPRAAPPPATGAFGAFASLSTAKSDKKKKKKQPKDDDAAAQKKADRKAAKTAAKEHNNNTSSSSSSKDKAAAAAAAKAVDTPAYKAKAKAAIDEYVAIEQIEEVACCVTEELDKMAGPAARWLLVSQALDVMLNCKERDRPKLAPMLLDLAKRGLLEPQTLASGFLDVLAHLPDILIDMPNAKIWLGDLLKTLVANQALDLAFLADPPRPARTDPDDFLKAWTDFKAYVDPPK